MGESVRRHTVLVRARSPFRQGIDRDLIEAVIGKRHFKMYGEGNHPPSVFRIVFDFCKRCSGRIKSFSGEGSDFAGALCRLPNDVKSVLWRG